MKFRILAVVVTLCLVLGSVACMHSAAGTTPPRSTVQLVDRLATYNDLVAVSINGVQSTTISLQANGLLTVDEARPVVQATVQVAQLHKQLEAILATSTDPGSTASITQYRQLLSQIQQVLSTVQANGLPGVKASGARSNLLSTISGFLGTVDTVLASLDAAPKA